VFTKEIRKTAYCVRGSLMPASFTEFALQSFAGCFYARRNWASVAGALGVTMNESVRRGRTIALRPVEKPPWKSHSRDRSGENNVPGGNSALIHLDAGILIMTGAMVGLVCVADLIEELRSRRK
jgi:hypothetical protein